jgi:hypothetical protein
MARNKRPADDLRPACFEGVQKWIDAGLHWLLAFASVWKLEVDSTVMFPHCSATMKKSSAKEL